MEGKVALITGAARGQGRSHALALAEEGADIVLFDLAGSMDSIPYELATPEELARTAEEVEASDRRALAIQGDVRDQQALDGAVRRAISEFGKIDIVVSNAGVWSLNDFWKMSEDEWQDTLDVNLTAHWRLAKAVAPHMMGRESGAIVMIASVGALEPGPRFPHYCAAKAGLLSLMRNVALELGPHKVRCNAVCPGAIDTEMNRWQGALDYIAGHPDGTLEERQVNVQQHYNALRGRSLLSPESTSRAVLWLCSDRAADVTGVVIPVDAGHLILPGSNPAPQ